MNRRCFASALLHALWIGLLFLIGAADAQEWSMWRGSRGDGISQETGVPTEWSSAPLQMTSSCLLPPSANMAKSCGKSPWDPIFQNMALQPHRSFVRLVY